MATARNEVQVDFSVGRDSLTPALNRIRGLAGEMKGLGSGGGSGFGAGFVGGLASSGLMIALDGIKATVASMGQAIKDASNLQTSGVLSADSISRNLGTPFETANEMLKGLRQDLSKAAAALPGEAKDYFDVLDRVSGSISSVQKDPDKFKSAAADISKRVGAIAPSAGADGIESGTAISRFISGSTSFGELRQLRLFEKTELPNIMTRLAKEKGLNISESKDWTGLQRLEVIQAALNEGVSDSLLARLTNTFDSTIQSIKSSIFDPLTGVLGAARELKSKGGRSLLDGLNGLVKSLVGLSEAAGDVLNNLGFGFDPMEKLIEVADWLSDIANEAALLLWGDRELNFSAIADSISGFFGGVVDRLYEFVDKIPADKIGLMFGGAILALAKTIIDNIPKLVGFSLKILEKILDFFFNAVFIAPIKYLADEAVRFFRWVLAPVMNPIRDFFNAVKRLFDQAMSLVPKLPSAGGAVQGVTSAANEAAKILIPGYGLIAPLLPKISPQGLPGSQPNTRPLIQPGSNGNGGDQKVSSNIFNPILNFASASDDPRAMAQMVIQELNGQYRTFQQGRLA